jgi:hypothetical protein
MMKQYRRSDSNTEDDDSNTDGQTAIQTMMIAIQMIHSWLTCSACTSLTASSF